MLENLNKNDNTNATKKNEKTPVKNENTPNKESINNKNKTNGTTNQSAKKVCLSIQLIDDAGKNGITVKSFEKIDAQFQYFYGKVYKVKLKDNTNKKEKLILKRIRKKDIYRNKQLKNVEDEINLIKQCDCPFIRKILYSFQDKRFIYLVEEYCPGGNLKWHINSNLFEEDEAKFYIAELILAIEYLHKKNICYKWLWIN